ncbi:MAG: hypothetical protein GY811_25640 [Myxococcales bacterium]|nr:hypothetical protein [Myxococcales bacterium]
MSGQATMNAIRRSFLVLLVGLGLCSFSQSSQAMFTNHSSKEINLKLIYVGLQLSGKSENLQFIYDKTDADSKGKMVSVATDTENTMFFDLLPEGIARIGGYRVRVHLYSLAGKEEYEASTRLLLKGADGIVFVADCQKERLKANLQALKLVKSALREQGRDWSKFPKVVQFNKTQFPNALPTKKMSRVLGFKRETTIIANTLDGSGVFETLKAGTNELLLGIEENRVKEWTQTPEEEKAGDQMTSRVRVVSHYGEFFGEGVHEYGPWEASASDAPFYVMVHSPTKDRPYFTYATFGLSTTPQAPGGPDPRIELIAYSRSESTIVVERLATIAMTIKSASVNDTPFKVFDTVGIGDGTKPDGHFALVPPEETRSFLRFPNQKRQMRDLLFTKAVGAATDAEARVTFLKLLPLTTDEAEFATEKTTRVLLKKFASQPKYFGWGRKPSDSVLSP